MKKRIWIIGLISGVVLGALVIRTSYGDRDIEGVSVSMINHAAQQMGANATDAQECIRLLNKAERTKDVSDTDWEEMKKYFYSENSWLSNTMVCGFRFLGNTKHHNEILLLTKPLLSDDRQPLNQMWSLSIIYRFKAKDWKKDVEKHLTHSDPGISKMARRILEDEKSKNKSIEK